MLADKDFLQRVQNNLGAIRVPDGCSFSLPLAYVLKKYASSLDQEEGYQELRRVLRHSVNVEWLPDELDHLLASGSFRARDWAKVAHGSHEPDLARREAEGLLDVMREELEHRGQPGSERSGYSS